MERPELLTLPADSQRSPVPQQPVAPGNAEQPSKPVTSQPKRETPAPGNSEKPPPQVTEEQVEEAHAQNLKQKAAGAHLYASVSDSLGSSTPPNAYLKHMQNTLREAGAPRDPVERMLIEQITLAHHNIGRLHSSAAAAKTVDEAKVYNAAAAKLLGEFRRTALALKQYREPTPARQYMMVKQQNIAAQQQVALVDGRSGKPDAVKDSVHEKKLANTQKGGRNALTYQPVEQFVPEESPTSSRRAAEPVEVRRNHPGGPRGLASRRVEEPAMGESDWAQDARG